MVAASHESGIGSQLPHAPPRLMRRMARGGCTSMNKDSTDGHGLNIIFYMVGDSVALVSETQHVTCLVIGGK